MRLEEYTSDAICRAMGLAGFVEPVWEQAENPTLRVVLTPPFHPELCITVACTSDAALLSVAALTEQLWSQDCQMSLPQMFLPHETETVNLSRSAFDEVLALFGNAHGSFDPEIGYVGLDGMGSESCLVSRAGTRKLHTHVSDPASEKFIARLIELAWNACRQPRVRNALSQAGYYLDLKYPLQEVPPQKPITRLAILGTPEEWSHYFEMLRQIEKRDHSFRSEGATTNQPRATPWVNESKR